MVLNAFPKSSMSNILMVAPQPFFRARGTPFSVLHRIRALLASGEHRVHLLTYPFGQDIELPGLTITRCGRPPLVRDVAVGPSLAKIPLDVRLYALTEKTLQQGQYDVIHSHEEAAFFCQHFADRHGIPHVYDMHSSLPQQLANFSRFNLWPLRQLFQRLEARVLTRCAGVITICPELAEIAARHIGGKPHAMIENTADDTQVFGASSGLMPTLPKLDGRQVVLYTGTLEKYQGLDLLVGAFSRVQERLPSAHLLLVGGTPAQVEALRSKIQAHGLDDCVTFTGSVPPSVIPAMLARADVIVSPRSRGTNTPLKIYGYMRSGKPIVATNLLTHTQTLSDDTACLVEPSAEGLAEGMCRVLADPDLGRRLAEAAGCKAASDYSDAAYVAKVDAFFSRVLRPEHGCLGDTSRMAV